MMRLDSTPNLIRVFLLSCLMVLAGAWSAYATHLRAGNIIVERIGACSDRTYRVTVIVYTNTNNTNVLFGGDQDYLDFGDKSPRVLVPEIGPNHPNYTVVDAQRGIASAYYSIIHVFPAPETYRISYVEPNRNEGVLNMDNSVNTTFYLETQIIIDPFLGCSTPAFLSVPPVDRACSSVAWTHNPGAEDPDLDSISYEMVIPNRDREETVLNYKDPNNTKFYTNFGNGNEAGNGPPTFSIDEEGTITWDAPGAVGEYNIAFVVREWRKVFGRYYATGFVRRDMQIIVEDCDNKRPDLEIPEDICVEAGTIIDETIFGTDPDNDEVKIEAFASIFRLQPSESPATFTPDPPIFQPSVPKAESKFRWETKCNHVREQPYPVVFKITDRRGSGLGLATFKVWNITVVGPAPTWEDIELDPGERHITIKWDPYECLNAERMEIWRKVDGTPFEPAECETGMPASLGYTKIAERPIKLTGGIPVVDYVDTNNGKGLAPGARYCYRLVAVYPLPRGGESYVSRDTCIGPLIADVPIITHVSVEKTGVTDGTIRISWKKPFEVDEALFPPPYRYDVYRAEGFTRAGAGVKIAELNGDTTFLETGLNTEERVYNYSIMAYSAPNVFVGESEVASSVRLEPKSKTGEIELSWTAAVPWSNQILSHPRHLIYRGDEGATESQLVLIDSVDVTAEGFVYLDKGQFNNTPLDETKVYCYRILARGGYGNPSKIAEPLLNFSQLICVQPGDDIFPCKPSLTPILQDCRNYIDSVCNRLTFVNELAWTNDMSPDCQTDIRSYNIYRASSENGTYERIATGIPVTVTSYRDENLPSFARCYKISAVDRSGNESELSDPVCNDNCPYYELPNVFSPNGDKYNELFSAYNVREYVPNNCTEDCPPFAIPDNLKGRCARFVESVRFKVFNRWGQQVYEFESGRGSEDNIYIDWDGRDDNGSALPRAVYYYVAEVSFNVMNPKNKTQTFKGWVHLLQ